MLPKGNVYNSGGVVLGRRQVCDDDERVAQRAQASIHAPWASGTPHKCVVALQLEQHGDLMDGWRVGCCCFECSQNFLHVTMQLCGCLCGCLCGWVVVGGWTNLFRLIGHEMASVCTCSSTYLCENPGSACECRHRGCCVCKCAALGLLGGLCRC